MTTFILNLKLKTEMRDVSVARRELPLQLNKQIKRLKDVEVI